MRLEVDKIILNFNLFAHSLWRHIPFSQKFLFRIKLPKGTSLPCICCCYVVVVPYLSSLVSGFSKQMILILKSLKIPGSLTRSSRILRLLAFILITILLLLIFREFHNPSKLFEPDNLKPVPNVIHFVHFINKEKEEVKPTTQIQDLVNNLDLC